MGGEAERLVRLGVHSRLEAASFAVRHRLPDLWAAREGLQAAALAVRPAGSRAAQAAAAPAAPAASTVRLIRPHSVTDLEAEAAQQRLASVDQAASAS